MASSPPVATGYRGLVHEAATSLWGGLAVTCVIASAVVLLLVGPTILTHLDRAAVGVNPSSDFQIMTWSLAWWPWALRHGIDPLHTRLLWPPAGFSTLWLTTIPGIALLAAPLTLTIGPLASYNLLMIAAAPLAAGAAYLLCRELTGRTLASLVGGLLFGLSPYLLGHTMSQHLDLVFVFPLPLVALVCVRFLRAKTSGRRFVVQLALLLVLQLGISLELFVDLTLFLALALVIAFLGRAANRESLKRLAVRVAVAYALLLPLLVPVGVVGLSTPHGSLPYAPASYAIDAANLVVPTPTLVAGLPHAARAIAIDFVGNVGEQDGYLGLPLIIVALAGLVREWRRGAWLVGALVACSIALSFGPVLTIGGRPLVALPFALARLPVLGDALPARLSLFTALGVSVLAALWLARPGASWLKTGAIALLVVSLLPDFWSPARLPGAWPTRSDAFGFATPVRPGFIADRGWQHLIASGTTVLVVPSGDRTQAEWWQTEAGMRFALAVPSTPFAPPSLADQPLVGELLSNRSQGGLLLGAARLRAYLLADRVDTVLVAGGAGARWQRTVALATGARPVRLGEASLYRIASSVRPLVVSTSRQVRRWNGGVLASWLAFNGRYAAVEVSYRGPGRGAAQRFTASSPGADASGLTSTLGPGGRVAVAFTQYRAGVVELRLASLTAGRWRIATLDSNRGPIFSVQVAALANGRIVASWISQLNPMDTLHVAELGGRGPWQTLQMESATDLVNLRLRASGNRAFAAFTDTLAHESRLRVVSFAAGRWSRPVSLAASLSAVGHVVLSRGHTPTVGWSLLSPTGKVVRYRSRLPMAG
jgi:hypothetical protein